MVNSLIEANVPRYQYTHNPLDDRVVMRSLDDHTGENESTTQPSQHDQLLIGRDSVDWTNGEFFGNLGNRVSLDSIDGIKKELEKNPFSTVTVEVGNELLRQIILNHKSFLCRRITFICLCVFLLGITILGGGFILQKLRSEQNNSKTNGTLMTTASSNYTTTPTFTAAATTAISLSLRCERGWTLFGRTQSCYRALTHYTTFFGAQQACRQQGAEVVSIHSQEENKFVGDLVTQKRLIPAFKDSAHDQPGAREMAWIGLESNSYRFWLWADRTLLSFTNWAPEEPLSFDRNEFCVQMFTDLFNLNNCKMNDVPCGDYLYKWNSVPCGWRMRTAVCKKRA